MAEPYIPAELRRLVAERANHRCEYCRAPAAFSSDNFTCDHILPRSQGGLTTADNLALACFSCNQHKSARLSAIDSVSGATVRLFHPRLQQWQEHFVWEEACTAMRGLTPVGRATVEALQLNRSGLVNLRRLLFSMGSIRHQYSFAPHLAITGSHLFLHVTAP